MAEIITKYPDGLYKLKQVKNERSTSIMWLYHTPENSTEEELLGIVTMSDIINLVKEKHKLHEENCVLSI
jgi:hypothetical protein